MVLTKHWCPRQLKSSFKAHEFDLQHLLPLYLTIWPDTVESIVAVGSTAILHILSNARFIERAGLALGETRRKMDRWEEHEKVFFKLEQISRWRAPHLIIWAWSKLKLLYVNYYSSKTHFHWQLFKNLHKLQNKNSNDKIMHLFHIAHSLACIYYYYLSSLLLFTSTWVSIPQLFHSLSL